MTRFEESFDADFQKHRDLGEDNAVCISRMRAWCKHAEIEQIAAGLYAEVSGLPIGLHSITCPHAAGGLQSMNLRMTFSHFLTENCAACPFHTPTGDTSWGHDIIDTHKREEEERRRIDTERQDRIARLRAELRIEIQAITGDARPESRRILEYFEGVFSEDQAERDECADRVRQAVYLGADIVPDAGIHLILSLAEAPEFAGLMLPVCKLLATTRPEFSDQLTQLALNNIRDNLYVELSAAVLHMLEDHVPYPLDSSSIEQLIFYTDRFDLRYLILNDHPDFEHSTEILIRNFDAEPESVHKIIRHELQGSDYKKRFRLCGALRLIQEKRPHIVLNLLDDLIESLQLYEPDRSDQVPSRQIVQILRYAFNHFPERADEVIATSIFSVRPTIQSELAEVYDVFRNAHEDSSFSKKIKRQDVMTRRLLLFVQDDRISLDSRITAIRELESAYGTLESLRASDLETLLGYLAIVITQEHPPDHSANILVPGHSLGTDLERLEQSSRSLRWRSFKQGILDCLKVMCKHWPSEAFALVAPCFDQTFATSDDSFKESCVPLLGEIGRDYSHRQKVMPFLWRALVDYESPLSRRYAIDAAVGMFPSGIRPPSNLVDMIAIHLRDPKVVVHQAALRAVSNRPKWFGENHLMDVVESLAAHADVYKDDSAQLQEIVRAITSMTASYPIMKPYALLIIEDIFPTGEEFVDLRIVENLIYLITPTEVLSESVGRYVSIYLGSYARDQYNEYNHSGRKRMFDWLARLSKPAFERIFSDLLQAAKKVAEEDSWESACFAGVFSSFRAFEYEQEILQTAVNALPTGKRYEEYRNNFQKLADAALINSQVQTGR